MTPDKTTELALKIRQAIGDIFEMSGPLSHGEMSNSLAMAMSLIVSYASMQPFLENLAACADAKEHIRAIEAGEVPDLQ